MLKSMRTNCGVIVGCMLEDCAYICVLFANAASNGLGMFTNSLVCTRDCINFYQVLSSTIHDIFYLLVSRFTTISTAPIATITNLLISN
jgi:hypothetical protein